MKVIVVREIIRQRLADALALRLPSLTRREASVPAVPGKAHAVIGMRRSGKTWFLYQLMSERLAQGRPRSSLVYLNFEDERLAGLEARHLSWFLDEYYVHVPDTRDREPVTFYLDEIQLVPGWDRFVRRILDSELVEVYVSGSSARMLSREIASSLRGRGTETVIFPFSFREFVACRGLELPADSEFVAKRALSQYESLFREYLQVGGFPEAQGVAEARDRIALLQGYVDTAVFRDVVERHAVTNLPALRSLVRQLLANPGSRFSVHRLYNDMRSQGLAVSKDTLHAMLGHVEDAFLLRQIPLATTSERQRQSNPRKAYPIDHGLARAYDRTGRPQTGHLLEALVAIELERRGCELGYVLTPEGFEVDFLARSGDTELLVQVCADPSDEGVLEREIRALDSARAVYPAAQPLLLTLERTGPVPDGVTARQVWRWLLDAPR